MEYPNTRIGGTNSYKLGSLKRRLDPVVVAVLSSATEANGNVTLAQLVLKGISGDLNIHIAAAPVGLTDSIPIIPSTIPAGWATMQLTPVVLCGNMPKFYLRPVFQDPFAAAPHSNNPLAQDLPFGWEFSTEADEVYINLTINGGILEGVDGNVIVQATVEYNGQWWDTKAIQAALGQVQLTDTTPTIIGTLFG
jgi:hypothetical protein